MTMRTLPLVLALCACGPSGSSGADAAAPDAFVEDPTCGHAGQDCCEPMLCYELECRPVPGTIGMFWCAGPPADAAPPDGPGADAPPCGMSGQSCCDGDACAGGLQCSTRVDGSRTCEICGLSLGDPCCAGGWCAAALYCASLTPGPIFEMECKACGLPGGPCCPAGVASPCATFSECIGTICQPCGHAGESCCGPEFAADCAAISDWYCAGSLGASCMVGSGTCVCN